jgi:hypothetical protein
VSSPEAFEEAHEQRAHPSPLSGRFAGRSGALAADLRCVEVPGARLFHPYERPAVLNRELRDLWADPEAHTTLDR